MAYPRGSSKAYQPLANLQSEINGAKSQWESLLDRLINGYKDAYKAHKDALKELERLIKKDTESDVGALMFIFSVVSVGFAGGFVGGLVAPWVEKAGEEAFKRAVREGVKDIAKHGAWGMVEGATKKLEHVAADSARGGSPYEPLVPDTLDQYLDKKEEFDRCFGRLNEFIEDLKNQSDKEQWPAQTGQAIQRHFWAEMPVLRDAPHDKDLPPREKVGKAAELLMWVLWAKDRDWDWWMPRYQLLDEATYRRGEYYKKYQEYQRKMREWEKAGRWKVGDPPRPVENILTDDPETVTRVGSPFDPYLKEGHAPLNSRSIESDYRRVLEDAKTLHPVLRRLMQLGKADVQNVVPSALEGSAGQLPILDLRKLANLPVDPIFPPLKEVPNTALLRAKFLDGLRDFRPSWKR